MTTLTSYTKSKVPLRSSSQHRYRLCCALRLKTAAVDTIAWGNFAKAMESSRIKKNTACQCLAVICQCHGVMTMTMIWQCVFSMMMLHLLGCQACLEPDCQTIPGLKSREQWPTKGLACWATNHQISRLRDMAPNTWEQAQEWQNST